ncbi:3-oxoacyl-ACP synthase [Lentzea sp. NBRC 105346]|uniref:beta-ketoacyl-[acyl-carrier-protein] synthase family protein n=1 Tax=Lentzea sp. NBRC 105346 TaxID=3032205 RepID=UPI0024A14208|nr:beta-ketoacyl-[acyl-carrier-protein] synthase family protein [Lentzea sp. NBRC 105346]GLZ29110.1 3-oxoacyl-ACP synthase [Lentzea sp. NBRC 105346]
MSRVVVTGVGAVSSIGTGAEFLTGLREGRCGARDITCFDTTGFPHARMHEVPDFPYDPEHPTQGIATQMTVAAARQAVTDPSVFSSVRGVVAVGTTDGDGRDLDALSAMELEKGLPNLDPLLARRFRMSRMPLSVASSLGLMDVEPLAFPNVCSAGNFAIGAGLDAIRSGEASYALVGGGDATDRRLFSAMYRYGALSPTTCRPFSADRTGVVFAEGAAMLMLESLEFALERGAPILAEVLDYNLTCDGNHPTRPFQEVVAECLRGALHNAGVEPSEVDLVMAHGTATKANDPMECGALADVFGDVPLPPITGIKSMIGHTAGAAGAHSCVAGVLAIQHGFMPPTVGGPRVPDPECPVDVPAVARPADVRTVLVNALGFGGANAAVVLRRFEPALV